MLAAPSLGQQPTLALKIDQVMTPDELRSTGVAALMPSQRAALDAWLNKYTLQVLAVATKGNDKSASVASSYSGIGSGHWIRERSDGGRFITLEDGSFWEINTVDQVDTALWLPITDITVILSRNPIGDDKYELINTEDDEKALAKYMGKQ